MIPAHNLVPEATTTPESMLVGLANVANHGKGGYSSNKSSKSFMVGAIDIPLVGHTLEAEDPQNNHLSFMCGTIEVPFLGPIHNPEHSHGAAELGEGGDKHGNTPEKDDLGRAPIEDGGFPPVEKVERPKGKNMNKENNEVQGKVREEYNSSPGEDQLGEDKGVVAETDLNDARTPGSPTQDSLSIVGNTPKNNKKKNRKGRKKPSSSTSSLNDATNRPIPGSGQVLPIDKDSSLSSQSYEDPSPSLTLNKKIDDRLDRQGMSGKKTSTNLSTRSNQEAVREVSRAQEGKSDQQYLFMMESYMLRITLSFEPFEPFGEKENKDEIYPGVIKPRWSAIELEDISSLEKPFRDFLANKKQVDMVDVELDPVEISDATFRILENHLKPSELENYHPLGKLDRKTFKSLQFLWNLDQRPFLQIHQRLCSKMNRYEVERRLRTLASQISQKTIVENWSWMRKTLPEFTKQLIRPRLEKLERFFRCDQEFPNETLQKHFSFIARYLEIHNGALKAIGVNDTEDLIDFFLRWMGPMEFQARFDLLSPHTLPPPINGKVNIKSLRRARDSEGVSFWNVMRVVQTLGLAEKDDIQNYEMDGVYPKVRELIFIILSPHWKDDGLPWSESADRHWLVQAYGKEYQKRLSMLCFELKKHVRSHDNPQPPVDYVNGNTKYSHSVKNHSDIPDILLFVDQGLPYEVVHSIKPHLDTPTTNGQTDWKKIFESVDSKFTDQQQQFLKDWFKSDHLGKPLHIAVDL
ncbi:hypothetical protein Pst134EB_023533 [Puccinia striiformis f. sp. tritici]|nr:hypothetical protein Pst134EB_023533 [Puccinia striiformis f. sp. tritici]